MRIEAAARAGEIAGEMPEPLHIITGPTAVGKTAAALAWAEENDAEIVSCDSLLVYRGMDIGTAKPTEEERTAVRHHCIDLVEPEAGFSVGEFVIAALAAVREIQARGKRVLVAGGSGFYLKAFYQAVTDDIPVAEAVTARVRELQAEGLAALQAALEPFAPERPKILDWENPRRVAKALERCLASGKPLVEIHAAFQARPGPFAAWGKHTVLLERAPEELAWRIEARVDQMLADGLVDEVRGLAAQGKLLRGTPAAESVGYRETLDWLGAGETAEEVLRTAIVASTRRLAAKQRKWFRTQIPVDETVVL